MTTAIAIRAHQLTKRYGTTTVLNAVNFEVPTGAKVALVGPNGAGKSTLLALLSTLATPTAGDATVAGYDLASEGAAVRRRIGVLTHRPMLYEELTPLENLTFFARLYTVPNPRPRIEALLRVLGLWPRRDEAVSVLSRGYHQRLAIGRALIHSPYVLLLDEPETGLDAEGIELLDRLMLREPEFTVLAATHRLDRVDAWADRTIRIERGRTEGLVTPFAPAESTG